ncbi:hypothetical protein [Streptomyces sp. SID3343]|uniref:hypothetical protein n=1 Tax=Streptomyces sp. SID3343 TaxID=2690260 RepID=UPI00136C03B5|nr:hypothetical protein [Streptomyces sp. SID3343]MYW00558.1 hypothetical protein [Streptomyces sp. SID3343]
MRVTRVLAAATTATVLALAAAAPAFANGSADTPTGDADRVGGVSEEKILHDLRPAILGVHQGIASSFVEVPAPNVTMPDVAAPQLPPR